MNLIIMGAPGVGKGTQAVRIADALHIPHISTGDIFREAVSKGTELGKKAKTYMDSGDLVPDDIVIGIVLERITRDDCGSGFILDGFPRTAYQAEELDKALGKTKNKIDMVLLIDAKEDEVIQRITGRRVCRNCGAVFHVFFNPSLKENSCDKCQGELYQRDDDKVDTATKRYRIYIKQTSPLINHYKEKNILRKINGEKSVDEVFSEVKKTINV